MSACPQRVTHIQSDAWPDGKDERIEPWSRFCASTYVLHIQPGKYSYPGWNLLLIIQHSNSPLKQLHFNLLYYGWQPSTP
jgi:hypothetical protein